MIKTDLQIFKRSLREQGIQFTVRNHTMPSAWKEKVVAVTPISDTLLPKYFCKETGILIK